MSPGKDFLITALRPPLIALAVVLAVAGITWADLAPAERAAVVKMLTVPRLALIGLLTVSALALLGLHLHRVAVATRKPALRIAEGIGLIVSGNPAHRVTPEGTPELCAIAEATNELAALRARLER